MKNIFSIPPHFQKGIQVLIGFLQANTLPGSSLSLPPSHMYGNRLNPNSAMATLIAQTENSQAGKLPGGAGRTVILYGLQYFFKKIVYFQTLPSIWLLNVCIKLHTLEVNSWLCRTAFFFFYFFFSFFFFLLSEM